MPQLNPSPWLMILITSWLILLILFNPKVTTATSQNSPLMHSQSTHKTNPWNWPWA